MLINYSTLSIFVSFIYKALITLLMHSMKFIVKFLTALETRNDLSAIYIPMKFSLLRFIVKTLYFILNDSVNNE